MPKLFQIDVRLYATLYIKADSVEKAMEQVNAMKNMGLEISKGGFGVVGDDGILEISGMSFDNPDLPEVSLSPAMTLHGPDDGVTVDLVEDGVPDEEDDEGQDRESYSDDQDRESYQA